MLMGGGAYGFGDETVTPIPFKVDAVRVEISFTLCSFYLCSPSLLPILFLDKVASLSLSL